MKLSETNRKTLMLYLHKSIEECADQAATQINDGEASEMIVYPPNGGLTDEEQAALDNLKHNDILRNALRKVLADNASAVLFRFLNVIDGTGDPDTGEWSDVILADRPDDFDEDQEFLHDAFFETYWDWRAMRTANFKLDLLDD